MSALCGIVHLDQRPVPEGTIEHMLAALSHRGGDGSGAWKNRGVALAHQRQSACQDGQIAGLSGNDGAARCCEGG